MRLNIILGLLLLMGCSSPKQELKITYIGNCGFLYKDESSKVLIDPFGTEFGNYFQLPTAEIQADIENGKPPFDGVDLVLTTHIHGDHFNPFVAEKYLLKNKHAKMICPPQVAKQMKDSCSGYDQIKAQIVWPSISMNQIVTQTINGISVTAIRMQHGSNRSLEGVAYEDYTDYEKTQNFGYLLEIGNKTIFHQGDGCLKINELALNQIDRKVDIANLSFFDWDSTSFHLLKEKCKADTVIFMHGTVSGKELQSDEFISMVSKVIVFKQHLETKVFN